MDLNKTNRWLIVFLLIFNIYGALLQNITGLNRQLFVIFVLFLIVCCFAAKLISSNRANINQYNILILGFELFLSFVHIFLFRNMGDEISMLLYFIIFFLVGIVASKKDFDFLMKAIVGISIAMCLEAAYYSLYIFSIGWRIFNVRYLTAAPKADYTFVVTLGCVAVFYELMFYSRAFKKKIIMFGLLGLFMFINIIVMQSKTSILVILMVCIVAFFVSSPKTKRIMIALLILSLIGFLIIMTVKSELIPDFIIVFINKATGLFSSRVAELETAELYGGTYGQRTLIYMFAFALFIQNAFFGIGFNQFMNYSAESSEALVRAVVQTESGIIGAFVEGGFFFGAVYLTIILFPGIAGLTCYINNRNNKKGIFLFLLSGGIFLLALNNDTNSISFWAIESIIFSETFYVLKENSSVLMLSDLIRRYRK